MKKSWQQPGVATIQICAEKNHSEPLRDDWESPLRIKKMTISAKKPCQVLWRVFLKYFFSSDEPEEPNMGALVLNRLRLRRS